jgi:NTE family protein
MSNITGPKYHQAIEDFRTNENGRIVLVLQGGGALGAYQGGIYEALHEAGVEPDWIVGTSIGAINASLIVGNELQSRLERLREFWSRMAHKQPWTLAPAWAGMSETLCYWSTLLLGIPGFFRANPAAFFGPHVPLGVESAGYYSTAPLRETLSELVDFSRINAGETRLTVGAAQVRSSTMRYFDSRDTPITAEHIIASGALPPAFPAVRIDGELYWDGGILSNTPTEVIFDDNPRRNSLIFSVHLWNSQGPEPTNIWDVLRRQKEVQYSSRISSHIERQQQVHRLRHVIGRLVEKIPKEARKTDEVGQLASFGCTTQMHVVRLLAPRLDAENHTKDIDFSRAGISNRWQAGYAACKDALERAAWQGRFDPLDGVILHDTTMDMPAAAE